MDFLVKVASLVLLLTLLAQPVRADTGDTFAWAFGFIFFGVFVCAGIGAYARKYDSTFK